MESSRVVKVDSRQTRNVRDRVVGTAEGQSTLCLHPQHFGSLASWREGESG